MLEYEVGHRESVKREGEGKERRKDAYERRAREREEKGCI